jgi:hypothetical protein
MPTEDEIYGVVCEEYNRFHREGPAKSLADLWQRRAARRIMELFAPKVREREPFVFRED